MSKKIIYESIKEETLHVTDLHEIPQFQTLVYKTNLGKFRMVVLSGSALATVNEDFKICYWYNSLEELRLFLISCRVEAWLVKLTDLSEFVKDHFDGFAYR